MEREGKLETKGTVNAGDGEKFLGERYYFTFITNSSIDALRYVSIIDVWFLSILIIAILSVCPFVRHVPVLAYNIVVISSLNSSPIILVLGLWVLNIFAKFRLRGR